MTGAAAGGLSVSVRDEVGASSVGAWGRGGSDRRGHSVQEAVMFRLPPGAPGVGRL